MITAENIIHHELIGLQVSVVASSNPSLTSIFGHIINETKEMLVIRPYGETFSKHNSEESPKNVAKKGSVFRFTLPDGGLVDVDGDIICTAPHRRIGMRGVKLGVSCIGL
jgi:ribonuclease P protein subunit POP4